MLVHRTKRLYLQHEKGLYNQQNLKQSYKHHQSAKEQFWVKKSAMRCAAKGHINVIEYIVGQEDDNEKKLELYQCALKDCQDRQMEMEIEPRIKQIILFLEKLQNSEKWINEQIETINNSTKKVSNS